VSDVKRSSIVTYRRRYKRPPRGKKAVPLTGPAIDARPCGPTQEPYVPTEIPQ
jgi:hypothetical protein